MNAVLGSLVVTHSLVTEWVTHKLLRIVNASWLHSIFKHENDLINTCGWVMLHAFLLSYDFFSKHIFKKEDHTTS